MHHPGAASCRPHRGLPRLWACIPHEQPWPIVWSSSHARHRGRPDSLSGVDGDALAVIAYNLAFLAVAPFFCTASSMVGSTATTVCPSLIGLRYTGEGIYNPSLMPAVWVGLTFAGLMAIAVLAFLLWKRRTRSSAPTG